MENLSCQQAGNIESIYRNNTVVPSILQVPTILHLHRCVLGIITHGSLICLSGCHVLWHFLKLWSRALKDECLWLWDICMWVYANTENEAIRYLPGKGCADHHEWLFKQLVDPLELNICCYKTSFHPTTARLHQVQGEMKFSALYMF